MSGELRTRAAGSEDRDAILDLVERSFGSDGFLHRPDFWSWKHDRNPFGPSPTRVAEVGGEIVALRTFLRWRFRWGGREGQEAREIEAVRAVDTVTREDWRGRGLFTRLTRELLEGLPTPSFVFNTPNEKSRPGYLQMGWRKVRRVPVWIRPRSLAALWTRSSPPTAPEEPGELGGHISRLLDHPTLPELLRTLPGGTGGPGGSRYRTPRTAAYLRWRYGEIPGFPYRTLYDFNENGDPGTALIFRHRLRGSRRELDVAEILTAEAGAGGRASRLLRRLVRDSSRSSPGTRGSSPIHYLAACAPLRSPEARGLLGAGFFPVPWVGPWLGVRRLGRVPGPPRPERWASWHLSLGDLEIF